MTTLFAHATTTPSVGAVAVMRYKAQGLPHFGYVEAVGDDFFLMSETNYDKCKFGYRFIPFDYPHLVGFYSKIE